MVGILDTEIGGHLAKVRWARSTIAAAQNQYEERKDANRSHENRKMDSGHGAGRFRVDNAVVRDGPARHWAEILGPGLGEVNEDVEVGGVPGRQLAINRLCTF